MIQPPMMLMAMMIMRFAIGHKLQWGHYSLPGLFCHHGNSDDNNDDDGGNGNDDNGIDDQLFDQSMHCIPKILNYSTVNCFCVQDPLLAT